MCTFELLGVTQQELVGVLHLQVKLDGLQEDTLQHHDLLLNTEEVTPSSQLSLVQLRSTWPYDQ